MKFKDQLLLEEAYQNIFDTKLLQTLLERDLRHYTPALQKLKSYSKDPNYFVSFTSIEKIGINPKNAFSTPIGVYAYKLKDIWEDWIQGDEFFGKDRPYINLIRLNTDRVCYLNEYKFTKSNLDLLQEEISSIDPSNNINTFIEDRKKEIERDSSVYKNTGDGALLWKTTETISKLKSTSSPKSYTTYWNKLFRQLGYDCVIDGGSIIHLLQNSQAVFFVPSSYELVDRIDNKQYGQPAPKPEGYWGSANQPYRYPGPNCTVDLVIIYNNKLLLIQRKGKVEGGKWAIPGGFIDTNSKKGEPFQFGRETPRQAALREVTEETNLYLANIPNINKRLKEVGVYEGNGRDPRDNDEAWSKSYAFTLTLSDKDDVDFAKMRGMDDASDAKWFPVNQLPTNLAFDHEKIIRTALNL